MRPSLIDYYDFLIQEHLGMILPAEDSNVAEVPEDVPEVPVAGDDAAGLQFII